MCSELTLLEEISPSLTRTLLYMANDYELDKFDEKRLNALFCLISKNPLCCIPILTREFYSQNLVLQQRMEILFLFSRCAQALSCVSVEKSHADHDSNASLFIELQRLSLCWQKKPPTMAKAAGHHSGPSVNVFGDKMARLIFYGLLQPKIANRSSIDSLYEAWMEKMILCLTVVVYSSGKQKLFILFILTLD